MITSTNRHMLDAIKGDFLGLSTEYLLDSGRMARRHYLDSAASSLMMGTAFDVGRQFLMHYANTHSTVHFAAQISTQSLRWACDRVLDFVGADKEEYVCIFHGSGVTGCSNRLARSLGTLRPQRPVVLVSLMEHHSNDLPHRRHSALVDHIPLVLEGGAHGPVCIDQLERQLEKYRGKVNYVAVTGVSNVTGMINPIHDIAELAHRAGAYVVVDGAQMIAHMPVRLKCAERPERDIDCFLFSGHKVYAPGSPGVLVMKKALLANTEPGELGGGIVEDVYRDAYKILPNLPDREQAGTPNIVGAVVLASVLEVLDQVGMAKVFEHERNLTETVLGRLKGVSGINIYGHEDTTRYPRVGSVAFNLEAYDHGFVAAILNDYHNVAVRSGCFCAHPYVRELIANDLWDIDMSGKSDADAEFQLNLRRGMVRASFALYTNEQDIDALIEGLHDISANKDAYHAQYQPHEDGTYRTKLVHHTSDRLFQPHLAIHEMLSAKGWLSPLPDKPNSLDQINALTEASR